MLAVQKKRKSSQCPLEEVEEQRCLRARHGYVVVTVVAGLSEWKRTKKRK
jgi:hypothetical protein